MKKLIFLLSIIAIVSGCSSAKNVDPNALPDGIMQPVSRTGAIEGGGFMPEVEQGTMPANMK